MSSTAPVSQPDRLVVRITATNRGPEAAPLHVLPTVWFRNTWAWQRDDPDPGGLRGATRPELRQVGPGLIRADHATLGTYWLAGDQRPGRAPARLARPGGRG
jgi:hypothetical protein